MLLKKALSKSRTVRESTILLRRKYRVFTVLLFAYMLIVYVCYQQEPQALAALREALHLAEPKGYIRTFVDEVPQMRTLLTILRW